MPPNTVVIANDDPINLHKKRVMFLSSKYNIAYSAKATAKSLRPSSSVRNHASTHPVTTGQGACLKKKVGKSKSPLEGDGRVISIHRGTV